MQRVTLYVTRAVLFLAAAAPIWGFQGKSTARARLGYGRLQSDPVVTDNILTTLPAILTRKRDEVKKLSEGADSRLLQIRLESIAPRGGWRCARALKRSEDTATRRLKVVVDLKRQTPTGSSRPTALLEIPDIATAAKQLVDCGADVLMVNTDGPLYGGSYADVEAVCHLMNTYKGVDGPVPVIAKDYIIHPIQIAKLASCGAEGVLLMAVIAGPSLPALLDACSCLGVEAFVEVHTPAELQNALDVGATNIVCTNWDRIDNTLHPNQAKGLRFMLPDLIVNTAAGSISTIEEAAALARLGFDAIIVGRSLAGVVDVKRWISSIRDLQSHSALWVAQAGDSRLELASTSLLAAAGTKMSPQSVGGRASSSNGGSAC